MGINGDDVGRIKIMLDNTNLETYHTNLSV